MVYIKQTAISVELVDLMGSDLTVVNAARVSMAKESAWEFHPVSSDLFGEVHEQFLKDEDARLIRYLAKHNHWTPFSHPQLQFRIKAPIFVARQWFKHMAGITRNETSRRYVDDEPEFYRLVWRLRAESVKQGSAGVAPYDIRLQADVIYDRVMSECLRAYCDLLELNIAPEQARAVVPQNMMTEWIETASLAAVCRACSLRLDPHAQQETSIVAEKIAAMMSDLFPVSFAALMGASNG